MFEMIYRDQGELYRRTEPHLNTHLSVNGTHVRFDGKIYYTEEHPLFHEKVKNAAVPNLLNVIAFEETLQGTCELFCTGNNVEAVAKYYDLPIPHNPIRSLQSLRNDCVGLENHYAIRFDAQERPVDFKIYTFRDENGDYPSYVYKSYIDDKEFESITQFITFGTGVPYFRGSVDRTPLTVKWELNNPIVSILKEDQVYRVVDFNKKEVTGTGYYEKLIPSTDSRYHYAGEVKEEGKPSYLKHYRLFKNLGIPRLDHAKPVEEFARDSELMSQYFENKLVRPEYNELGNKYGRTQPSCDNSVTVA